MAVTPQQLVAALDAVRQAADAITNAPALQAAPAAAPGGAARRNPTAAPPVFDGTPSKYQQFKFALLFHCAAITQVMMMKSLDFTC